MVVEPLEVGNAECLYEIPIARYSVVALPRRLSSSAISSFDDSWTCEELLLPTSSFTFAKVSSVWPRYRHLIKQYEQIFGANSIDTIGCH